VRCDVFDAVFDSERFSVRSGVDLIEGGYDRVTRASMAAARIRNQKKDALGH
jgi:hypothetical protein